MQLQRKRRRISRFRLQRHGRLAEPRKREADHALGVFNNGPPIRQSGRIVAFDAPVVVGTWDVTIGTVPEPRGVAVVLAILLGVMVGSRCWFGVKP